MIVNDMDVDSGEKSTAPKLACFKVPQEFYCCTRRRILAECIYCIQALLVLNLDSSNSSQVLHITVRVNKNGLSKVTQALQIMMHLKYWLQILNVFKSTKTHFYSAPPLPILAAKLQHTKHAQKLPPTGGLSHTHSISAIQKIQNT